MREIVNIRSQSSGSGVVGAVSEAKFDVSFNWAELEAYEKEEEYLSREAEAIMNQHDLDVRMQAKCSSNHRPMPMPEHEIEPQPESKRFKVVSEADLVKIEEDRQEKTTKRSTKWGVKVMKDWCKSRGIAEDFEGLPIEELVMYLREFYGAVRQKNGQLYSLPSYRGLRAAIQRHLINPPFNLNLNIISDPRFSRANHVYDGIIKSLKNEGLDVSTSHPPIATGDLQKMFNSDKLSKNNPKSLQRLVWFYLEFHFCRRGSEGLRELRKDSFVCKTDDMDARYFTMSYNEKNKNHPGGETSIGGKTTLKRMYETKTDTCPVAAMELYLNKLSPESNALFQRPKQCVKQEEKEWYTKQPVGVNTLGSMLKNISKECELSRIYTNHSVRATTITALNDAGFETRVIMAVSGHRSEASVRSYCTDINQAQKRQTSNALQYALGNAVPNPQPMMIAQDVGLSVKSVATTGSAAYTNPPDQTTRAFKFHNVQFQRQETAVNMITPSNAMAHLFQGCKFKSPVVINFNHK